MNGSNETVKTSAGCSTAISMSATVPTSSPTVVVTRKYTNPTFFKQSIYHLPMKRPRILVNVCDPREATLKRREADPLIGKPLLPATARLSYLKSPRMLAARQSRVHFSRPPIPAVCQHQLDYFNISPQRPKSILKPERTNANKSELC